MRLPSPSGRHFYRLWIVEGHAEWIGGLDRRPLDLGGTLWFFPKYFRPGIPYEEVEGFAFWFDDEFVRCNPLLGPVAESGPSSQAFCVAGG